MQFHLVNKCALILTRRISLASRQQKKLHLKKYYFYELLLFFKSVEIPILKSQRKKWRENSRMG